MIEQPRPAFKQRTVHGKRVAFSRDEEGSPARAILLGQCYSLCGFPGQGFDEYWVRRIRNDFDRTFVPIMLAQDEEGWVINTGSQGGLVTSGSIYGMTKHSVVALSEALHLQLKAQNAKVGVSVLCPNFVDTRLMESERNRPRDLWNPDGPGTNPLAATWIGREGNIPPEDQAEMVLQDLRAGRFYMFPYMQAVDDNVRARFESIINRRNPEPRPLR